MGNVVGLRLSSTDEQTVNHYLKKLVEMFLRKIPPGFRFDPTDDQIFNQYLKKKNLDPDDISVQFVKEIGLLKYDPWELRWLSERQREDEDWYFFYSPEPSESSITGKKRTRNREFCKNERFKRGTATGTGYWKSTGKKTVIKDFGVKRILVFYLRFPGSKKEVKTNYVIHEYEPSDIPANKKPFFFLRLIRNKTSKIISNCEAGPSQLLASNSDGNFAEITLPAVVPLPPAQLEITDGLNNINHNSISAQPSSDHPEEEIESLKRMHAGDTSSLDEGQSSQEITHSSIPVECQPHHHHMALDCGNHRSGRSLTEMVCQLYPEFSELFSPQVSVPVVQESSTHNHTSFFDQGQPSPLLTPDFAAEFANDTGQQVDSWTLVEPETHDGGSRLGHIHLPALPPPNHLEYEPSSKSSSQSEAQIDPGNNITNLHPIPAPDITSCNSIGGLDVGHTDDANTNPNYPWVKEYSLLNVREY